MANTFKNATITLVPTSSTTIYTCPAATQAIVFDMTLANVDAVNTVAGSVFVTDASAVTTIS